MTTTAGENVKSAGADFVIDKEKDEKAREALRIARVTMLLSHGFWGQVAMRLQFKNADSWCQTLATDGRRLYYNSDFVLKLKPGERVFGVAHELGHVIYDHMARFRGRDLRLSNIAADFCVNGDLYRHNVGEFITTIKILHDPMFYGWSYEQVYEFLKDNVGSGGKGKGQSQGNGKGKSQSGSGGNKPDPSEYQGTTWEELSEQVFDEHLDQDGGGSDKDGEKKDGRPVLSEEERQEIGDEIRDAVLSAAASKNAGDIPAGIRRIINDLEEPKMNWKDLLAQEIDATFKSDYTWMKPHRRSAITGVIFPSMIPEKMVDICVTVDMSGSISVQQAKDFFSEVKGIMQMYKEFRLHLWTFDVKVYNPKVFTQNNLYEIHDYYPQGGGGTDFMCNWEYMRRERIQPEKLVMFTDGYPNGEWGEPMYCDTLFVIHGPRNITAPFGLSVNYHDA